MRLARQSLPCCALAAVLLLMTGCGALTAGRPRAEGPGTGVAYQVRYEGPVDPDTLEMLKEISKAESLRQSPPDSILLLERRAEEDIASFMKVFASKGFFAATATAAVDAAASPAVLTYRLDPGSRFELGRVRFLAKDGGEASGPDVPAPADLGLTVPGPFAAKAVVDAETRLTAFMRRRGHPLAKVADRHVTADFADHQVTVAWTLDPGPEAAFGRLSFQGLASVRESYPAGLVPWQEGEPFNADLLERYRAKLSSLDLFASIQVEAGQSVGPDGRVPVVVTVTERKHRTIKGGVDFKTDEGPGANLGWEHRNLFGGGEKLAIHASGSAIERLGEVLFEKPDCITPKELFRAKGKLADEDKKAYKGQNATATAVVRRQFTEVFSAGAGVGYRASRIEEDHTRPWDDNTQYGFAFIPLEAGLDTRDNVLDPTRGVVAALSAAPYFGTVKTSPTFLRPEASLATYLKLAEKPGMVLALRGSIGASLGARHDAISPDLRFYAGGAGSIRGYPYQTVGPLRGKTPIGGGSVLTFSTELRLRVTELIGLVPFIDGGTAYAESLPSGNQPILLGAGLGLRIYTPVGPVRLDVATPLTRRKDIDDLAQFYCSIGQSF